MEEEGLDEHFMKTEAVFQVRVQALVRLLHLGAYLEFGRRQLLGLVQLHLLVSEFKILFSLSQNYLGGLPQTSNSPSYPPSSYPTPPTSSYPTPPSSSYPPSSAPMKAPPRPTLSSPLPSYPTPPSNYPRSASSPSLPVQAKPSPPSSTPPTFGKKKKYEFVSMEATLTPT